MSSCKHCFKDMNLVCEPIKPEPDVWTKKLNPLCKLINLEPGAWTNKTWNWCVNQWNLNLVCKLIKPEPGSWTNKTWTWCVHQLKSKPGMTKSVDTFKTQTGEWTNQNLNLVCDFLSYMLMAFVLQIQCYIIVFV